MNYKIKIFSNVNQKRKIQDLIEKKFQQIFLKKIPSFQHYFLDNPYGSIIVAGFDPLDNLVGMGHIICLKNFTLGEKQYNLLHFTTSMIDERYRRTRLYFDILDTIKEQAHILKAHLILAFPNSNALPILTTFGGFKKANQLQWFKLDHVPQELNFENFTFCNKFLSWRFSRFHYFYTNINNYFFVYKEYNQCIDILSVSKQNIYEKFLTHKNLVSTSNAFLFPNCFLTNNESCQDYNVMHVNQIVYYPISNMLENLSFTPIFSDVF